MGEPPIVPASISARIAALKIEQVGRNPETAPPSYDQAVGAKKKPPPPPPRPGGNRAASTNNPPLASNGVASSRSVGNQPAKGDILPAPVLKKWEGRDQVEKVVPSLPARRPTGPDPKSPPLPPRRPSGPYDQSLTRKQSTDSISSIASGRSSVSVVSTRTSFSATSGNQYPKNRIRAPEFDRASLPPLPERKVQQEEERLPLRPTISAPNGVPQVGRTTSHEIPPSLPSRPALPSRTGITIEPPPPRRSALEFGMNKSTETPPPIPQNRPTSQNRPIPHTPTRNGPALIELDPSNFDEIILRSGKPALVDFYATFCNPCKEVAPIYAELAEKFKDSGVIIAKIDSYTHDVIAKRYNVQAWPTFKWFDGKGGPPIDYNSGWELHWFCDWITEKTGIKPGTRANPVSSNGSAPPPVPLSSRPNISDLQKSKPKASAAGVQPDVCLKCRDFSGPDNHAARFPRQAIPSTDVTWLAHQLCDPFPSATDKARAIFTWLHHNIDYNTDAFFSGNIKSSTPNSTIASGLAVCEGYAALFTALATPAGLESVVVGGHGKGYGHNALASGAPIPPRDVSGHAWNAVKIDHGQWKLLDACWGAGNVSGKNMPYERNFKPNHFTMSNDEFGIEHYPEDSRYFFRDDGRPSITWEEYMLLDVGGEKCTVYTGAVETHGLDDKSFSPKVMDVKIKDPNSGPTVRFQFNKICQHYDLIGKHGKPYLFYIKFKRPGQEDVYRVFQTDGYYWWLDVPRQELGHPGEDLAVFFTKTYNNNIDGRGLTEAEFHRGMRMGKPGGWNGWGGGGLAKWRVAY